MTNAVKVARIHLVNSLQTVLMPWAVLTSAFLINLLIFGSIGDIPEKDRITGALSSIYIVALIANLQSVTQFFPFIAGLSRTRRAFLGGTGLFVLGQSVVTGIVLCILGAVERATDGWGLSIGFFAPPFLVQDNQVAQFFVYAVPYLLLSTVGLILGSLFKRWGQTGMYILMLSSIVVVGGLVALVTWRGAWGDIGRFFTDTSVLVLTAGYPALATAILALGTYGILRRTTP